MLTACEILEAHNKKFDKIFRLHVLRHDGVLTTSLFGQWHFDVQIAAGTRARGRFFRRCSKISVNLIA